MRILWRAPFGDLAALRQHAALKGAAFATGARANAELVAFSLRQR